VTFAEIDNLSEGQRLLSLTADGVTKGEEEMFNRLAEEL